MNMSSHSFTGAPAFGNYMRRGNMTTSSAARDYQPSKNDFISSFYAVLRRWKSETMFLSDPEKITSHQSYSVIVKNAELVAPFIIEELKEGPSLLVWVLDDAFDDRPYSDNQKGDIAAMSEAWISWAVANNKTISS